uniref:Cyclin-dependent kinase inhibitor domain-containing protein n=1 Tax=Meloidogyne floridensis TaxID=298350 RepID=A0A915P582_9BILA
MDGLAKRSSRRSLFGSGRAPETDEWLKELENKNMEEKVKKWNFDFREDKPLDTNETSTSHVYEAVNEEKTVGASGVSRSLFIHPAKVTKQSNLKIGHEKVVKTTITSKAKEDVPSTSELNEVHEEEKPTVSTSTLPSSSTSLPSPHKRLRKARRSEITPQKRKKVVSTSTTGIGRKRAKRGIKMEKDG